MPGAHLGAIGRVVDRALGAWLNEVAPRVVALAGSCPLARLFGIQACLQPVALAPDGRAQSRRPTAAPRTRAEPLA